MATANARSRRSSGPGTGQWVALGLAVLVILGLTFSLGLLVGRQWARQLPPVAAAESAKKSASAARRSGLAEAVMERPPELGEKLTFYQTLTAPLNSASPPGKGEPAQRPEAPKPQAAPASAPAPAPAPAPPIDEPPLKVVERATGSALPLPPSAHPAESAKSKPAQEPAGQWTVQVAAFKARAPAERLQKQLVAAGFDAYVTEKGGEGQAQFRVRVGTFKTREDAAATVERVKAERSLAAFVTTR